MVCAGEHILGGDQRAWMGMEMDMLLAHFGFDIGLVLGIPPSWVVISIIIVMNAVFFLLSAIWLPWKRES